MTKKREYTELQQKFLDVVMDEEHRGDIRKAMKTAGYSNTVPSSVILNSLSEELVELAKKTIAANAPKAVYATLDVLQDGAAMGSANKLKAATTILERAGAKAKDDSQDIHLKVPSGGLVILPAKEIEREDIDAKGQDA